MDTSNRRIVILGKTGVGKSSLANTIFGGGTFMIDDTANSGTRRCEAETKSVNGRSITLIDTPGFFDTGISEDELRPEIVRCITECAPGPHAFLIVFKVERFTEQEQAVINKVIQYFSEEAFRYATVVFTHGDQLPEGQTIDHFVHQNTLLSDLVMKCGGRCHVVDNRYWNQEHEYRSNQFQVEELLKTIDRMVMENNGSCYTNEMLQAVEEEIQREEENIRLLPGNMSDQEIRRQAVANVSTRLSVRLAGVATGVLVGALCGVVVSVGIVVAAVSVVAAAAVKVAVEGGEAPAIETVEEGGEAPAIETVEEGGEAPAIETVEEGGEAPEIKTAGGTAAAAVVGKVAAAVLGTSAAAGGLYGGARGYSACEGADTEWEAAKNAAGAVMDDAECAFNKTNDFLKKIFQPKS